MGRLNVPISKIQEKKATGVPPPAPSDAQAEAVQAVNVRASTPKTTSSARPRVSLIPGHGDQISPIVATQGDDHPPGNNNNYPKAHDGPTGPQDYDSDSEPVPTQYKHPSQLAEARRHEWPAVKSMARDYPLLAQAYEAVI